MSWLTRAARSAGVVLLLGLVPVGCADAPAGGAGPAPVPVDLVALINHSTESGRLFEGQFCGGTVVAPRVVLTAQHCVTGKSAGKIDVLAQAVDLCSSDAGARRVPVERVVRLPGRYASLAALELTADLGVGAASPRAPDLLPEATPLKAFGWGRESFGGVPPCTARGVDLTSVGDARCAGLLDDLEHRGEGAPPLVCATTSGEGVNTCDGDSGGPVLAVSGDQERLAAVTMSGDGCGNGSVGLNVVVPPADVVDEALSGT